MRHCVTALAVASSLGTAHAAVREDPVSYKAGDATLKGIVVYDDANKAKRPGVIVVHEWWGITDHVRREARNLAGRGYTAFIADMYGDARTADNPTDAGALMQSVVGNPPVMRARFEAARDALAKHPTVDAKRIAAIGFCMGGSIALDMARAGEDLAAVVAFHAGLDPSASRAAPGKVKAKVLVLNGADDPFVKRASVDEFKKEMDSAKVDYRFVDYPGAVHAFTNPDATAKGKQFNLPLAYNAEADKRSKEEMAKFLAQRLGK